MELYNSQNKQEYQQKQYIFQILVVKGIPFYGFHLKEKIFLKIFIYNPQHLSRMIMLLHSGAIMNTKFEVYESHISFILQVMIDYNLYGMDFIHLSSVKFRLPLPKQQNYQWNSNNVSPDWYSNLSRQSFCQLEVDAKMEGINLFISI